MSAAPALIAFIATADATRARGFYDGLFGLKLLEDSEFALVFDANGTMLRIQRVEKVSAPSYTALGWRVDDIASSARELANRGVRCEHFEGLGQDDLGIWMAPDGTRVAWFKDPDGHILSLTQFA